MNSRGASADFFREGVRHHQSGAWNEARVAYQRCLELAPSYVDARINLAGVLRRSGELPAALAQLQAAIHQIPQSATAHYNLGNLLRELNEPQKAADAYRQALRFAPQDALTWYNLGLTLAEQNENNEAKLAYQRAMALDPAHREARLNLAVLLAGEGQLTAARDLLQDLLSMAPDYAPALTNLANVQKDMGQVEAAIATLKRASSLQPDLPQARSNLLLSQQYHAVAAGETRHDLQQQASWRQYQAGVSAEALLAEARAWGEWATLRAGGAQPRPVARPLDPISGKRRPLRVGYVSADLAMHPVGLFLKDVLAAHASTAVLPFAYSNGATIDEVTRELQRSLQSFHGGPDGWREVRTLDDAALAAHIRADAIDILVDLSGHTAKTRLPMFAMRPAPVQISWLGYFATTGLPAMDAVLLDPWHAPAGTEAQFTETLVRLPYNRFCYTPVSFAPAVSPAPTTRPRSGQDSLAQPDSLDAEGGTFTNRHITFGCFNNTAKLNEAVLACWAHILHAVPHSRLILKWSSLADTAYRQQLTDTFAAHGIAPERIELRGRSSHAQLLAEYADIDIALDPFPFCGGQTSCEALWMGVPVITWPQERVVSRQTWSFLANIGLTELAATSAADYVAKAVALANDTERLAKLRQDLRPRMAASPLCDVSGFTRALEQTYRGLWQRFTGERIAGDDAHDFNERGAAQMEARQLDEAVASYRLALLIQPELAAAHYNLGNVLRAQGEHEAAAQSYRCALALRPDLAVAHNNLGNALRDLGRFEEAAAALERAIELQPDYAAAHNNLGSALFECKRIDAAAACFRQAIRLQPDLAVAHKNLGDAHKDQGQFADAVTCYRQALALGLNTVDALNNLGITFREMGQYAEAIACYRRVLALDADQAAAWCNLGLACHETGKLVEAEQHLRHAIALQADFAIAHNNLGSLLKDLGRYAEAVDSFKRARAIAPTYFEAHDNELFSLNLIDTQAPAAMLDEARAYGLTVARRAQPYAVWSSSPDPSRPLSIGWVSGDLCIHPVGYFIESVLAALAANYPAQFQHVAYASHYRDDAVTARLRRSCAAWHPVMGWSDAQLAAQIHADGIDILIDLAGHTAHNRLPAFAWKPAPVQVSWLGYFATTGVREIDWLIADPHTLPQSEEAHFTEKIWRLPETRLCFTPPDAAIPVGPLPALTNGIITFGCFNNLAKMNDGVVALWSRILTAVPASRLLLKTKQLADAAVREHTLARFAAQGIGTVRLTLEGPTSRADYLAAYQRIDLALDPFPYPGGTTTVEALWMGVPVLTLAGERFLSRQGVGLLMNVQLPEWVASDPDDYLARAIAHAQDLPRLAALRNQLRPQLLASPLCDAPRFARHFALTLRGMWQAWCNRTSIS